MDITPDNTNTQPISDDQELAKALAGVLPDDPTVTAVETAPSTGELQFEETPASTATPPVAAPAVAPTDDTAALLPPLPDPTENQDETPSDIPTPTEPIANASELEGIKNDALNELRPLIDHVDLSAEEKFDTYLMLIRSTDDSTLIAPAHKAAQNIADEKRKAEALLDIIKEIDYLSKKDTTTVI